MSFYLQQLLVHLSKNSSKQAKHFSIITRYACADLLQLQCAWLQIRDELTRGAARSRGWSRTSGLKMILGWVKSSKLGETETFPLIVKLCLEMSNKIISNISNPGLCLKYNLVKECPHISHRVTLNIIKQNKSNFEKRNIAIIKKISSAILYRCLDVEFCFYLLRCG